MKCFITEKSVNCTFEDSSMCGYASDQGWRLLKENQGLHIL